MPLVANGEVIGALDLQSEIRQFFTPDDIRALHIARTSWLWRLIKVAWFTN